jgi:hypothetical protein
MDLLEKKPYVEDGREGGREAHRISLEKPGVLVAEDGVGLLETEVEAAKVLAEATTLYRHRCGLRRVLEHFQSSSHGSD